MKKALTIILSLILLGSCSLEDDGESIMQNLAPVQSVDMPDSFELGQTYSIGIIYRRPTSCHTYSGLNLDRNGNEIVVGIVTSYSSTSSNCVETGNLEASATFNFVVVREDFYTFKFWQGRNSAGNDMFLIVEVPVTLPGSD